jgi:hypothetical protein
VRRPFFSRGSLTIEKALEIARCIASSNLRNTILGGSTCPRGRARNFIMASNQPDHIQPITASGRTWSLKKQAQSTPSPKPKSKTVNEEITGYEIEWEDLKEFLVELFPRFPQENLVENVCFSSVLFQSLFMLGMRWQ